MSGASQQAELIDAMVALAQEGTVDLVVKGSFSGIERGWVYRSESQSFEGDEAGRADLSQAEVLELASPVSKLVLTVVPRGSGERIGIDRNRNGVLDFDEL